MKILLNLNTLGFFLLSSALLIATSQSSQSKKIKVIAITDLHGALEPDTLLTPKNEEVLYGGAVNLAGYIDQIRKKSLDPVFVIDGGDLFQGTLVSNTAEGKPVITFYNKIGVDATTVGNHEFDYGVSKINKEQGNNLRGALLARFKEANFPFLAVNIVDDKGNLFTKASTIITRGQIKVGIIGAATVHTPETTNRKNLVGLQFLDPAPLIVAEAKKLRDAGVDFVILTTHAGGTCKTNTVETFNDLSSCDTVTQDQELFKIIDKMPVGTIDLAIGGHTHMGLAKNYKGTPILQAYSKGKNFGLIELEKEDSSQKKVIPHFKGIFEVCGSVVTDQRGNTGCNPGTVKNAVSSPSKPKFNDLIVEPSQSIYYALEGDFRRVAEIKKRPLGISALTDFFPNYFDENALGNMLASILRSYLDQHPESLQTKSGKLDLVLLNNGGLRAPLHAGHLTFGDVYSVMPFDNGVAILTVSYAQLKAMIETGISRKNGGISWAGLNFHASECFVKDMEIDQKSVDQTKMYRVLVTDFLANGGSGFGNLKLTPNQIEMIDPAIIQRDLVVSALMNWKNPVRATDYFTPEKPSQVIEKPCAL